MEHNEAAAIFTHQFVLCKGTGGQKSDHEQREEHTGVDGELWSIPALKMRGVLNLTDKGYKANPLRRVYIEKKGKKPKRPLGIPCMYDRAMQALYALALDPVAETTADTKSFGFRKGRCAQDACEYIFTAFSRSFCPEWVLEGDIKGCFDHISHDWLVENIPMDKSVLKQFLKAGFVFREELFPTEEGTPQGSVISPILANMTLDGMQKALVDLLCSSVGSLTNPTGMANALNTRQKLSGESLVSQNTVRTYMDHLADAFLFSECKRYDVKGKNYFDYPTSTTVRILVSEMPV